tara:strand:+ start:190 stop:474 length:285 start_codon:yes stop_codon:yes gene_type:complete
MKNIFDIVELRDIILSYIYPPVIKRGMLLQYRGSKKSKRYMNKFIGNLYVIDKYLPINLYPFLKSNGVVMTKDVDTEEGMMFFPDEDDLKIVLV